MKKIVILFATIIMIALFAMSASAKEVVDSGECGAQGDNVTWVLYDDGELELEGIGEMRDYDMHISDMPWFPYNPNIKKIMVNNGITSIGTDAFSYSNVEELKLADTVTNIKSGAFYACNNLTSLCLHDGVERIGRSAFSGGNINEITIPSSVQVVESYAFGSNRNLINIFVDEDNQNYCDIDGVLFSKNKMLLCEYPMGREGKYDVPDGTVSIGEGAFRYAVKLTDIKIPGSVVEISSDAFSFCEGLSTIKIGENVSYIGDGFAEGSNKLNNILVDENNKNYCDINGVLYNEEKTNLCMYPAGREGGYEIPNGVNTINRSAFNSCKISNIIFPSSLNTICEYAFRSCENFTEIIIPQSVRIIGKAAFEYCRELKKITISNPYAYLESDVFDFCNNELVIFCHIDSDVMKYAINNKIVYVTSEHLWDEEFKVDLKPTCTEKGRKSIHCQICDDVKEVIEIAALGHNYVIMETSPTCTTSGTKTYTCTCGDTYTETIPANNHANATTDPGKAPTTTEVGYTAGKYCPDCKTWIEGHEEIPMLHTHTYTSTITKEATCWREGEKTYTCTCGDSYTEAIAKLDHEYRPWETKKNPTCTEPGLEWSYCLICDNDFEREIPATGHTIIDYTRRATPDSDGAYVTACDVCNEVFKSISFGRPTEYKLSTAKYTYDGKIKTPKLTVETSDGVVLKEGVDYELELPSDRKTVGVYTYRVVFKGDFLGEKKVSYQILPSKTSKITATQSTSAIKLTWKKVTGADGYRVYQYNSKTGKYEKIKTTTGTSYTVKKLKAGTTYKFAVKAYTKDNGETLWAASYKTFTTATKPATPTVKATAGSKQATISWNKVAGATGYVVYMQDDFGDYNKIGSTKKTSYTRKKLTKGKTYYFRVRAYKTVDGKNIYGGYKTVKVKVK